MKTILKRIVFYAASLFIASQIISGLKITGGPEALLIGGIALTVMMFALKPILQLISFPFNLITFGLFSFVVNGVIIFLLTVFVPFISVNSFSIPSLHLAGFSSPSIYITKLLAFPLISLVLSGIFSILTWLTVED